MKEKFDEEQYIGDETKETTYFYSPKTFLDLLCNLRLFFRFWCFFHLTYFESEFGKTLEYFWRTLESSLKNSFLLFCTAAHIKKSGQCCNIASSAECPLHKEWVDFSPSVSGSTSPHALFEATWVKDASENTHFWVVISGKHGTHLFPQPPPAVEKPYISWPIHFFLPWFTCLI